MHRTALVVLGVVACLLVPASNTWADNSVLLNLGRIDDFIAPTQEFDLEVTVTLGAVEGVTGVTVQAGTLEIVLVLYSPEDGEWETDDDLFYENLEAVQAGVGGNWTVTVSGSQPSTSVFTLDAALLTEGDFFPTPSNVFPANGATNVEPDVEFSWTDPTGVVIPYVLGVETHYGEGEEAYDEESFSVPELGIEEIPITATSWQPEDPLTNGIAEFDVFYVNADLSVLAAAISEIEVSEGDITWGNSDFSPPGYPASTPLLALSSSTMVQFSVPEPSAALLAGTAFAVLAGLSRRRSRVSRLT